MTSSRSTLALDPLAQRALFTEARSATAFAPTPVGVDTLKSVYELIKWGPTGNNAMPLRLAIAESSTAREAVARSASPTNRAKIDAAPLMIVAASDADYHELTHVTAPGVEGLRDRLHADHAARLAKSHDNTWLQVGYLIVGLRAAGLAVRPLGGFDKAALTEDLFAGTGWNAELLLAVGYPATDGAHGAGERKPRPDWDHVARVL